MSLRWPVAVLIAVTCIVATPFAVQAEETKAARRPNVVVILADDLGYGDVGFQGCTDIPTPCLDALANSGTRLTSGYVSGPLCVPTRADLMAGRYHQPVFRDASIKTMAQYMKDAGYATAAFGKWHLGEEKPFHPQSRGFDEFFGFLGGAHDYLRADDEKWGPIIRGDKPVASLDRYLTDAIGDEAVAFIERHRDHPFFAYVAFNAVHAPAMSPPGGEESLQHIANPKRRTYAAMTKRLDEAVGRIVAALEATGLRENTLVFFLSDNGGPVKKGPGTIGASNGPLAGEKCSLREGGIRVPFVVSWPGVVPAGKTDDRLFIQLDILPTALAAAGVALDPAWGLEGTDMIPYLTGSRNGAAHDALFWGWNGQMAVRQGPWKLVRWADPGRKPAAGTPTALHNLDDDIGEAHDLADKHPDKVRELQALWDRWDSPNTAAAPAPSTPGVEPRADTPSASVPSTVRGERLWSSSDVGSDFTRVLTIRVDEFEKGSVSVGFQITDSTEPKPGSHEIRLALYDGGSRSWQVVSGSFRLPGRDAFTVKPQRRGASKSDEKPPVSSDFIGTAGPGRIQEHEISLYLRRTDAGWGVKIGDESGGECSELVVPFALLPADSHLAPFASLAVRQQSDGGGVPRLVRIDAPAPVVTPEKGEFGTLQYQLFRPVTRPGETYPLVVCLHGAGGTGTENRGRGIEAYAVLKAADVQAKHPSFLLVPQKPAALPMWADWPFSNGSYDLDQVAETPHIKSVRGLIQKVIEENQIDPARVYVTGQSMGGFGTWDIALRYPDVFAAAIPICGGGSPKHAARLKDMAIWSFHGDEDRSVPVSGSREMAKALEAVGASKAKYTEFPGAGHVIMDEVWATPGILDWLFSQRRGDTK